VLKVSLGFIHTWEQITEKHYEIFYISDVFQAFLKSFSPLGITDESVINTRFEHFSNLSRSFANLWTLKFVELKLACYTQILFP
jgi:hypothetical protein